MKGKSYTTVDAVLLKLEGCEQALDVARALGLAGTRVVWNGRLRTTAGMCYAGGCGSDRWVERVELNPKLRAEGSEAVRRTLLHELGHAVAVVRHGHHGHGALWVRACQDLGLYGEGEFHDYASMTPRTKVVSYCPSCGYVVKGTRYRPGNYSYTHTRCGRPMVTDPEVLKRLPPVDEEERTR